MTLRPSDPPARPARAAPAARRRLLAGLVALAFAAGGAGVAWWRLQPAEPREDVAALLWGLTLNDAAGAPVRLDRFRGRPLVVNFWATWCAPCVKEMPELSRIRDEVAPKGIETLGIAIDSPSAVRDFAARHPVSYPLVVGGMGGTDLVQRFGNASGGLPFTVVLAADGQVAWQHLGVVEPQALRAALAGLR